MPPTARTTRKYLWVLTVAVGATGLLQCTNPPPASTFGPADNPRRRADGLPELPGDWVVRRGYTRSDNVSDTWMPPVAGTGPRYCLKAISAKGGKILWEEDGYTNGRAYKNRDPDHSDLVEYEGLSIQYYYDLHANQNPGKKWRCFLRLENDDREIDLAEAEKILESWGLRRLNY
jgi:hypothetical protein